jgi:signal transduction histidine kinase
VSGADPGEVALVSRGGGRPRRLRTHLLALVLVVLVPAFAVGAVAVWRAASSYRAASEARLLDTARALALALDGEIERAAAAATVLAAVPELDEDGDPAAFEPRARQVAAALGSSVFVIDAGRRRILDTAMPPGAPAPAGAPLPDAALAQVFATGRTAVAPLAGSLAGGEAHAAVLVPVTREERTIGVVGMALSYGRLSALLAAQGLPPGEVASLADARGVIVARSPDPERSVGRQAPGWYAMAMANARPATMTAQSLEGETMLLASAWLRAAPGWVVAVATPHAAHVAGWRAPLQGLAFGAVGALTLAALLAAWLARRLLRPVEALAEGARAVVAAEHDGPALAAVAARSNVTEFETLRLGLAEAEAALRRRAEAERQAEAALRASAAREQTLRAEFLRLARVGEIGQMAATLAHELNQPLAALTNYLNGARRLLEQDGDRTRLAAARDALAQAAGASLRAGQIVRRMLALAARGEAVRRIEAPAALVEEASELALVLAGHAGVQVRLELDRQAPKILADRVQIRQVVLNLMHNAIEAMADSGGERRLTVTLEAEGAERVAIAVADTGPGLPEQVRAELFAPFMTTKRDGVGIGLSVCRTIVEAHGGRIRAEPNPGGGTVFRLTLPAVAGPDGITPRLSHLAEDGSGEVVGPS